MCLEAPQGKQLDRNTIPEGPVKRIRVNRHELTARNPRPFMVAVEGEAPQRFAKLQVNGPARFEVSDDDGCGQPRTVALVTSAELSVA